MDAQQIAVEQAEKRFDSAIGSVRTDVATQVTRLRDNVRCGVPWPLLSVSGILYLELYDREADQLIMLLYDLNEGRKVREIRFEEIYRKENATIVQISPSFDGRKVAVAYSIGGSDFHSIDIYACTGDLELIGRLEQMLYAFPVWSGDSSALLVAHHIPDRGRVVTTYDLATGISEVLSREEIEGKVIFLISYRGVDDVCVIVSAIDGLDGELWFWNLKSKRESDRISYGDVQTFPVGVDSDGQFWILEVAATELRLRCRTDSGWRKGFAIEGSFKIPSDVCLVGDTLFIPVISGATTRILRYSLRGERLDEYSCPDGTGVGVMIELPTTGAVLFRMNSFTACSSLWLLGREGDAFRCDIEGIPSVRFRVDVRSTVDTVVADDGTGIPVTVIESGKEEREQRGCLVKVYAGYGVVMAPNLDFLSLSLAEYGISTLIAHVRGGGEYGIDWQIAGRGVRKQRTIDDLAAVLAYAGERYRNVGLMGESHGGLIALASALQSPHLCTAAICSSGVYNLQRYLEYLNGTLHVETYGDPRIEEEWSVMQQFSPAHIPLTAERYPHILFIADRDDDRVNVSFTEEMIVRLNDAPGSIPVYARLSEGAGHGYLGRSGIDAYNVDIASFLVSVFE